MTTPLEIYQQQITEHKTALARLERKRALFGWLRFLSMGAAFVFLWLSWSSWLFIGIPLFLILVGLFFYILTKDLNNTDAIENLQRLLQINETEIGVLEHHFTHLPDGSELRPEHHDYANDLDVFGRASLYQYINRCTSDQGKKLFADWLLAPTSTEMILQRQEAVKELEPQIEWRQQLQAHGLEKPITKSIEQKVETWLQEPFQFINKPGWQVLGFLLPAISFTLLILHIAGIIEANVFYPAIILMMLVSFGISKKVMPAYIHLDKTAPQLETLSQSISWIEKQKFSSKLLLHVQSAYVKQNIFSSQTIRRLKNILDRFDIRLNPLVFIPLNTFLFWDIQQILILESWKKENKDNIGNWFHSLAEIESLSSLAVLSFNHPHWVFPTITEKPGNFAATSLGHPLIPADKLVTSDFSTTGNSGLNLVTGSNMAGKSTFLRSVGVNIVLAMMGSVVCAESLTTSHFKVLSSMRVSDNLEENTSTFYAELKKLKEVIEAVYRNEDVFLLLDEILRGTNSADRHTGSKALIKQLIHHNATGLIATHDLELAKLADEFPNQLHNYHFDVQVTGEELYFDYKLKKGICTSMNASLLMKKIGIEI